MGFSAEDVSMIKDVVSTGKAPETPPANTGAPAAAQPGSHAGSSANQSTGTPAPGTSAPAAPAPGNTAPATTAAPADPFDITSLGVKDANELKEKWGKLSEYEKKVAQLEEYKAGPKFKSDRHKFIYDLAERSEGMELSSVRQLLDVVELLESKDAPDQRVRFEAFKLRPENKGLSQEEIGSLFMAEEVEKFGNPQDDANPQTELQKIRAKQATTLAKETLSKLKNDWDSTRPVHKSPEELAKEAQEYRQVLQKELTGFDGIPAIKLSATDAKGEKLEGSMSFKIDADKQMSAIIEAVADPQGMWESLLEESGAMAPGQEVPDFKKFGALVTRIKFMDEMLNQAYQQGAADLEANRLKTARNVADPASGSGAPPAPPAQSERKEANMAAMKVAGLR